MAAITAFTVEIAATVTAITDNTGCCNCYYNLRCSCTAVLVLLLVPLLLSAVTVASGIVTATGCYCLYC